MQGAGGPIRSKSKNVGSVPQEGSGETDNQPGRLATNQRTSSEIIDDATQTLKELKVEFDSKKAEFNSTQNSFVVYDELIGIYGKILQVQSLRRAMLRVLSL